MTRVPEPLEQVSVRVSVEGWRSHVATLTGSLTGSGRACVRGNRPPCTHFDHRVPEARWGAEGADTVGLHLAQDLTEVHWWHSSHPVGNLVRPTEVLLLRFAQDAANHVHANAWRLGKVALDRVEVRHNSDHKVAGLRTS